MRMTYCIRTSITNPYLESTKTADSAYQTRGQPEVLDSENSVDAPFEPSVDSWKATNRNRQNPGAGVDDGETLMTWQPKAIADPSFCRDEPPVETQPCNRIPCPGVWLEKRWSKVSLLFRNKQQSTVGGQKLRGLDGHGRRVPSSEHRTPRPPRFSIEIIFKSTKLNHEKKVR